jgi:hypothetical protein
MPQRTRDIIQVELNMARVAVARREAYAVRRRRNAASEEAMAAHWDQKAAQSRSNVTRLEAELRALPIEIKSITGRVIRATADDPDYESVGLHARPIDGGSTYLGHFTPEALRKLADEAEAAVNRS